MKSSFRRGLSLMILGAVISACAPQMVKERELGEITAARKVLIAEQQSEFKGVVVSAVSEALEKDGCFVRIIDLRELRGESTWNYDAVVVVNTLKAWRLNRNARTFFNSIDDRERRKVVLLTSANGTYWKVNLPGVDAITSASKMEDVDFVAADIVAKVRAILTSN
ncbi:hypothetical protein ACFL4G_07205 [Thermodesulfobacteriota bacterium]